MSKRAENGFFQDLDTSVWRSGKKGRLRRGGSGLVCRKRSSSLLFFGSACFSVGQSMFNLATTWVTTSNSSSYCGDWGGESTLFTSTSSEEDRRSAEPAPRGGRNRRTGFRERAVDLAGEEEDRDLPISIPSISSSCESHECSSLKSRLCVLRSQADHAQTVCIPARDAAWAGRNTQSITQSAFTLICLCTSFRHAGALRCWMLGVTWQTTVNKTHRTYNPKSEKVGTIWKTQIKKESSDF